MRYGFIGLGNLGQHLAGSLVRAGFDLTVNDLSRANAEACSQRAPNGRIRLLPSRAALTQSSPACRRRKCRRPC